jgi:sugar/nucleoside kinase (ribokinase family)
VKIPFAIPGATERVFDLVGLGQNSVDYLLGVPTHPAPNSKLRTDYFVEQPGGQVATALVTCARLGWRTRYVGTFGDDEAGSRSRESLVIDGVDVSAARTIRGARNRVAVILVQSESGERTVLWYRDPSLCLTEVPTAVATSGRLLLVDAEDIGVATLAAVAARSAGIPTIVDVDDVRPGTHELLAGIDAIIVAEDFPAALTGHPQLGRALELIEREYRAPLVCVTLGEQGSLARCGGREFRTRAAHVECVDSTGAGDVFRGAFASACLRWPDGDVEQVLAYANLAAALSCRAIGARGGLPHASELDRLFGERA